MAFSIICCSRRWFKSRNKHRNPSNHEKALFASIPVLHGVRILGPYILARDLSGLSLNPRGSNISLTLIHSQLEPKMQRVVRWSIPLLALHLTTTFLLTPSYALLLSADPASRQALGWHKHVHARHYIFPSVPRFQKDGQTKRRSKTMSPTAQYNCSAIN